MSDLTAMMLSMDSHSVENREEYVRAPFPYPGAKSRSVEKILPHLPYRGVYCEPFGGSGAVLLSRNESPLEIFNDRFAGVTCFYRALRDHESELIDRLQLCLHSREEFLWSKATWKNCEDVVERAARWWYMVSTSFGSMSRNFGRSLKGKAMMGPKIKNNLQHFHPCHNRLVNVQIENQDWRLILKDYDNLDMVWYLDPPYYEYNGGMYECEMSKDEHKELMERIFQLEGFVAISGYSNRLYDSYPWNAVHTWEVQVSMLASAFTESNNLLGHDLKRGKAQETLYIKEAS